MRWAVGLLLHHRRLLAAAQGRLAQALFDETTPATDIVTLLEEETLRVQAALRFTTAGRLQWASALLQVLADAEARRLQREATGSAVLGVPTGLTQLDNLLGGLNEGLYLLAGAPGMGKTTLALQVAAAATTDVPVVVVTFEHAPANLTLKLLCARAGVNLRDVQRGYADLAKLRRAAEAWEPIGTAASRGGRQQPAHGGTGARPGPPCHAAAPGRALSGGGRLSAVVGQGRGGPAG
jgi:replicative DNA helicase